MTERSSPIQRLLTLDEAADRMRMSVRYVRRLIAERRIEFVKLGRSVRLDPVDVQAFIDAGRVKPLTPADVWPRRGRAA